MPQAFINSHTSTFLSMAPEKKEWPGPFARQRTTSEWPIRVARMPRLSKVGMRHILMAWSSHAVSSTWSPSSPPAVGSDTTAIAVTPEGCPCWLVTVWSCSSSPVGDHTLTCPSRAAVNRCDSSTHIAISRLVCSVAICSVSEPEARSHRQTAPLRSAESRMLAAVFITWIGAWWPLSSTTGAKPAGDSANCHVLTPMSSPAEKR
mmetsp:Transcript_43054/g.139708  ORF Transcript_43054/g.139708 Transcript_43054/m.139708 type:complete len:205 (-) Transcript_43054:564-1178(-)